MPGWMPDFIAVGGFPMYPLLIIAATVAVLIVNGARRLAAEGPDPRVGVGIDAILFWGAFGVVVGVIGTLVGITQAARAIERAGAADAALAWGGIRVALTTTVFGLLVFGVAALGWWVLRTRYRRRLAAVGGATEVRNAPEPSPAP